MLLELLGKVICLTGQGYIFTGQGRSVLVKNLSLPSILLGKVIFYWARSFFTGQGCFFYWARSFFTGPGDFFTGQGHFCYCARSFFLGKVVRSKKRPCPVILLLGKVIFCYWARIFFHWARSLLFTGQGHSFYWARSFVCWAR